MQLYSVQGVTKNERGLLTVGSKSQLLLPTVQ